MLDLVLAVLASYIQSAIAVAWDMVLFFPRFWWLVLWPVAQIVGLVGVCLVTVAILFESARKQGKRRYLHELEKFQRAIKPGKGWNI